MIKLKHINLRPNGTVSQIFEAENLKDILPKSVDTLGLFL